MKKIFASLLIGLLIASASGGAVYAEWVNGYTKKNGTYVSGYNRSDRNNTVKDNYSY